MSRQRSQSAFSFVVSYADDYLGVMGIIALLGVAFDAGVLLKAGLTTAIARDLSNECDTPPEVGMGSASLSAYQQLLAC